MTFHLIKQLNWQFILIQSLNCKTKWKFITYLFTYKNLFNSRVQMFITIYFYMYFPIQLALDNKSWKDKIFEHYIITCMQFVPLVGTIGYGVCPYCNTFLILYLIFVTKWLPGFWFCWCSYSKRNMSYLTISTTMQMDFYAI